MKRKICVITGTRAEYGLLRYVMQDILDTSELELQLIVTGMHLSPEFGLTYREIEKDGFQIDSKVEMLLNSDSPVGVTKSMGVGLIGFADALQDLKPDLLIALGDRYETFCGVIAALIARIPVAHLHGGEATEGAFDEAIRHSITKMSHIHFVAAEEYKKRVIQLGEHQDNVFLVGGLGVDNIKKLKMMDRASLEAAIGFQFGKKNLLVTFHPVTLEDCTSADQFGELLNALEVLEDTHIIFTMPNADTDSRVLIDMLNHFVGSHKNSRVYHSLGQLRYLSCIQYVDAVVGNSSSGLTEVPSFRKATINIGDRQRGRLKAASVIDCDPDKCSIAKALEKAYSRDFQKTLLTAINPYGEGGASKKIVETLRNFPLDSILKKSFQDAK